MDTQQKTDLIEAYKSGLSYRKIAKQYNIPFSKVYNTVRPYVKSKRVKMSTRKKNQVKDMSKRGYSANDIHKAFKDEPGCSLASIYRTIQNNQQYFS